MAIDNFIQDLRFAVRTFTGRPAFTFTAVFTLALGIGATTAIFSVVDGIMFRPLDYENVDRIYEAWPRQTFTTEMIDQLREEVPALETVASYTGWRLSLIGEGDPVSINAAVVSADFFDLLGAEAMIGRTFRSGDDRAGNSGLAILSYSLWVNRFGADSNVVGRSIRMGGAGHENRVVVGVMPPDFRSLHRYISAWVPTPIDATSDEYTSSWFNDAYVRLAPDASEAALQDQLRAFAQRARDLRPDRIDESQVAAAEAVPLQEIITGDARTPLLMLLGGSALVLLVACANVTNLFLSLAASRERELALRMAVGAGRGRIVAQLVAESLALSAAGGAVGLALAYAMFQFVINRIPFGLFPRLDEVGIDTRVLLFSGAISLGTTLIVGLLPAWRASGRSPNEILSAGSRGSSQDRRAGGISSMLVAAEVALAIMLVFGSGVLLRSFAQLNGTSPGFATDILTMRVSLPPDRYSEGDARRSFYRQLKNEVEARPGVVSVGAIQLLPLEDANWGFPIFPEGRVVEAGTPPPSANFRVVTPGYLETARYELLTGRYPSTDDVNGGERVIVVNETFAREHWPDESALGKSVSLFSSSGAPYRIVGVVGDVHQFDLTIAPEPEMYMPLEFWPLADTYVMVRADTDPMGTAGIVKDAIWSIDDEVAIDRVQLMSEVFGDSIASERVLATLIGSFAILALLLGSIGVYGVTSYHISQSKRDIGIRMALGAAASHVLGRTLVRGLAPVVAGLVVGSTVALAVAPIMESMVYQVSARDLPSLGVGNLVMVIVACAALITPAIKASRVDPNRVLREE